MKTINIEIDGKSLEVAPGTMVIQAADAAGIYIPRFCYHEKLSVAANCRMCMVEVEKAPKPLPACATPVAPGMVVRTDSKVAVEAQKGTMEFLLINHPLDCPVCDQGGECPLQDQAMGYGKDASRFAEKKRVVEDKDIGPLIATEMTRCIHCTRCVRFGEEVAGIMELGMVGRGEHAEITTFLGDGVTSELSGNMIDLCPVGALTSKPYRFTARPWELLDHPSISPHDCVGANINVQSIRDQVKRVLPRSNAAVNECWLADRDRFSYEALNDSARLTAPMIRDGGDWRETDWQTALDFAVNGIREVISQHGPERLGALAAPTSTLEEFYLLQKLIRGLGSPHVDHRLRQKDFRGDQADSPAPGLDFPIADIAAAGSILLVGSNIRKDQPLLGLRVRNAFRSGARVMALNCLDYDFHFDLTRKMIVPPSALPHALARIVDAAHGGKSTPVPVKAWVDADPGETEAGIAQQLLADPGPSLILIGDAANNHRDASVLHGLANALAEVTGAKVGILPNANSAAGWAAACVPHREAANATPLKVAGRNAADMLAAPLRGYILLGAEPGLDCADGRAALAALERAQFVVALNAFDVRGEFPADVLLPIAPFSETPGTYINCEGRMDSVTAAVPPQGESRPAWKVLRVLGNCLELDGFDYTVCTEILAELDTRKTDGGHAHQWPIAHPEPVKLDDVDLERIADVPLYRTDGIVRRAPSLQATRDNPGPCVRINGNTARYMEIVDDAAIRVYSGDSSVGLTLVIDDAVPDGCVYIPSGHQETVALGGRDTIRLARL